MSWQHKIENKRKVQQLSTVENPQKVKVLILTDQKAIYSDFYFITRFVNIVKLDLSYNKLSGFSVGFSFRNFKYLRTLFLHYNKFSSIKSVALVKQCDKLEYLTLFGNPLQETKTRHYFVNQIRSLKLMDDKIIRMQQRNPQIMIRNKNQNIKLPFPIINIAQSQNSTYFLSAVIAELRFLRQKYLNANPIIKIQRWFRRKLNKKDMIKRQKNQIKQSKVENQKIILQRTIQKLMTQQLIPHKLNQQKILSLLQMNYTFLQFIRKKSQKKVFALRQFCEKNNLKYEDQSKKIICLRIPNNFKQNGGNNHLQLIIKSSHKYLLRRIGSQNSMNFSRKYPILNILIRKRKKRQPKYFKQQTVSANKSLSQKINKIQDTYCSQFVLIKQDHQKIYNFMKKQFFKSIKQKELFPFCFQQIMERSAAAVSIQRMWRGYIIRKKFPNSYLRVTKNHAAWLIQRYIRNLGFRKRSKLFVQLLDYIKKQVGSNQLIIPFDSILNFKNKYDCLENSINFSLPDQKIKYWINTQNQILMQKNQTIIIPSYFSQYLKINIQENQRQQKNQNILDILFKGIVAVKYLSMPVKQKSLNSSIVKISVQTKIQNKSMKGLLKNQAGQKKQQISQRQQDKLINFVVFQYKSTKQCLNRKFLLALYSYNMIQNFLLRSYKFNFNKHNINLLKNINEQINQNYVFMHIDQENQEDLQQIQQNFKQRQVSNEMKFKFFVQQKEHVTKIKVFYPIQPKINKKDYSIALPLRQLERKSILRSNNSSNKLKKQQSVSNTAHISRTIISIFPKDTQQSANFMSYRQKDKVLKSKLKYRYDNQYLVRQQKQKSLQKCQSLQPMNKNQGETSFNQFSTFNNNAQKNLTTQGHLESVTQNLRKKFKQFDNSFCYTSTDELQVQNKKKKIYFLKNTHRDKLLQSSRYKQEQLSKLRQKMRQQLQQNYRIIQSARLQNVLANTRKHNMVKRALSKQVQQIKNFQRDFMKKGNSSIRKDLIKFQNDRSSKSPDNQSIYESMKSLDAEILKQHLLKRSKQIFNIRTQIKQFSIDGSEGQHDISLAIDLDKKSKQISKRLCDDHKNSDRKSKQHIQSVLNKKSNKKDLKKKRLVHSVFPQQFYPLKQTKKIGFQLPKINHK